MSNYKSGKRYADVLTILLVIIIIAIICLLGYFGYKAIDKKSTQTNASNAADEFEQKLNEANKDDEEEETPPENTNTENTGSSDLTGLIDHSSDTSSNTNSNSNSSNTNSNKTYLDKYEIKGIINIPKTGIKYPILEKVTVDSLTKSVAILDITACSEITEKVTSLNVPGTNVFILGHNYRNGMFFSDNDKLVVGDSIKITDDSGNVVTYKIYDMYYTSPNDAEFMERDIAPDTREITLQTCNSDSSQRLIILARDK